MSMGVGLGMGGGGGYSSWWCSRGTEWTSWGASCPLVRLHSKFIVMLIDHLIDATTASNAALSSHHNLFRFYNYVKHLLPDPGAHSSSPRPRPSATSSPFAPGPRRHRGASEGAGMARHSSSRSSR
ncbi:hypothetical protein DFH07DRAFT_1063030 [Mycena maculata]|uniref:Uncharacterized protein n=1 Tax=Mycena maculata TaxID=230809 RepID=A0AAD7N695_9AGAR|nr:hypothetical protein DFH07DRAFT_1063030 [Mycena maculata]